MMFRLSLVFIFAVAVWLMYVAIEGRVQLRGGQPRAPILQAK